MTGTDNPMLKKTADFIENNTLLLLSAILFVALFVRIVAFFSLKHSIYFDALLWDERIYHEWAKAIADGTYTSSSVYEFAPLPAYIIALVYHIFSPDVIYFRIVNIIFGVMTCFWIYFIGKSMGGKTTGLFSCLIAALYKPFIFYSIVPLKTSLSLSFFSLCLFIFLNILEDKTEDSPRDIKGIIKAGILGLICGLMLNVRANYAVMIPIIPIFMLLNSYKKNSSLKQIMFSLAVFSLGLILSISPFIIRNYRVAGEFALTTSQTGRNLYYGNNLINKTPYYQPLPFASSTPDEQAVQFIIEASRRAGKKLSPQEASAYWTREVVNIAIYHPGEFLTHTFNKILGFFNCFEAGDHYHIGFISRFISFFKLPFLGIWLILPLGMAGMLVHMRSSRKYFAMFTVFFMYAFTLVLFVINTRYRLPVLLILIPFTVMGLRYTVNAFKTRQVKQIYVFTAIAAFFFVIESLPVQGAGDMTAYYNTHAYVLSSKGNKDEAIGFWEKSSQLKGTYSAVADLYLAGKYYEKGEKNKAHTILNHIPDQSFMAAFKYSLLGDLLQHEGKTDQAVAAYKQSLEINSGQRRIRKELIKNILNRDRDLALKEYMELQYIESFFRKQ